MRFNVLSQALQQTLTQGRKKYRIVTTFDAQGRVEPVVYLVNNHTRTITALDAVKLGEIAALCDHDPEVGPMVRTLHAQFLAEKSGLAAGHA